MTTKYKPLRSWVVIEAETRPGTIGGIFLPDTILKAEIVQEGAARVIRLLSEFWPKDPNAKNPVSEIPFKEGDRIMFRGFLKDIHTFEEGGHFYSIIHFEDILAVLPEETKVGIYGMASPRL